MKLLDCAYSDCELKELPAEATTCPQCGRYLIQCVHCNTSNRTFAIYCRNCGEKLERLSPDSWPCSRGGIQRQCLNPYPLTCEPPTLKLEPLSEFKIPSRCRFLLAEEGYLFAFTLEGQVEIRDTYRPSWPGLSFGTDGKIYAEPAISGSTLYIGSSHSEKQNTGTLAAYNLGCLPNTTPEINKIWSTPVHGVPTQGILKFENRLYFKSALNETKRELNFIDLPVTSDLPVVHKAWSGFPISAPLADPKTKRVYFLHSSNNKLFINSFTHETGSAPLFKTTEVVGGIPDFHDHAPLATYDNKLYTIFGEENWLCCLNTTQARFEQRMIKKVKQFSLRNTSDMVILDSAGLLFPLHNNREPFIPGESTLCPLLLLSDKTTALGLRDGRLRFYKQDIPSIQCEFRIFDSSNDEITALTSFGNKIAAGNQHGLIKIFQIK